MPTTSFSIKKNGQEDESGPFTLDQLRNLFDKREITLADSIRDAHKPRIKWTKIEDSPELLALLRSFAAIASPAEPRRAHGEGLKTLATAHEGARAAPLADSKDTWRRKDLVSVIVASVALGLTLFNTGWVLFTNADAKESKPPVRLASDQSNPPKLSPPSTTADGTRGDNPQPQKAAKPENPGNQVAAGQDAVRPANKQSATLEQVMTKLDKIDSRLTNIEQHGDQQSARQFLCQAMESGALEFRVADADFRFIFVPAGTFRFGYPAEEQNRVVNATGNPNAFLNASPDCMVTVARGFFMLDRELTAEQWDSCSREGTAEATPVSAPSGKDPQASAAPKRNISWLDANSFCSALQRAAPDLSPEACEVRLPTEIEWEYAARGSQSLTFPWIPQGAGAQRFLGSAKGSAASPITVDLAQNKDRTWRGQVDFAGNLSEWCLDQYDQSLHEALVERQALTSSVSYDPTDDPLVRSARSGKKNEGNPSRTLRGGSILDSPESCELPMRRYLLQNKGAEHIGLRPVIVLRKVDRATAEGNQ